MGKRMSLQLSSLFIKKIRQWGFTSIRVYHVLALNYHLETLDMYIILLLEIDDVFYTVYKKPDVRPTFHY